MTILDHIILGDGPVSTVLQSAVASSGGSCLVLDCGSGLKVLSHLLNINSNINYQAKSRAPSLNQDGSAYMWAGGLQGWPDEDWMPSRDSGLPGGEFYERYISAAKEIKQLLGIRNFDFRSDLPIFSARRGISFQLANLRKIYCKVLVDPRMTKLKLRNSKNSQIKHIDSFIAIKVIPKSNFVRVEGISTLDGSSMHFDCKRLHLALGTIENTRLLLHSRDELDLLNNVFLGRYLSDHLTFKWATYSSKNLSRIIRHFSRPKTYDGNSLWPRIKFENIHNDERTRSFAHVDNFVFDGRVPLLYRFLRRLGYLHLYFGIGKSGKFDLNLFVEKINEATNGIEINGLQELGIACADINFNLSDDEILSISEVSTRMEIALGIVFPDILKITNESIDKLKNENLQAGTHCSGTYRMSLRPDGGVVNVRSELWSDNRIRVLGAGTFPIASATHPTFTSMVLALIGVHEN